MLQISSFTRRNDTDAPEQSNDEHHSLSGWAIFIIVVVVLLAIGGAAWLIRVYLQRRQALSSRNYPAPAPGGVVGWFNDKLRNLQNRRHASGSYEATGLGNVGGSTRGRRGAPLDPDEAWDSRVGNEADIYGPGSQYEEQELGLHAPTAYSGTGYGGPSPGFGPMGGDDRGRSRSRQRELDERYDQEAGRGRATNPFSDDNATSLRGVSPRPLDTRAHERLGDQGHSAGNSPTERRSMFREDV